MTTYEIGTGKRGKLVRKLPALKPACKADEVDTFWRDGDKVTDRCRDLMTKVFGPLMGANGVAGSKSLVVLLQGPRIGEIALLDPKTLAEKRAIKLPWCDGVSRRRGRSSAEGERERERHAQDARADEEGCEVEGRQGRRRPRDGRPVALLPELRDRDLDGQHRAAALDPEDEHRARAVVAAQDHRGERQ